MKKIEYNNINEFVYYEVLKNGFQIFLYPTKKTKNFYVTVSTFFGASVTEYQIKGSKKINKVIPGTAHFLEHRLMDFTKNKKAMEEINNFGSIPNAYTTYEGTNYNIFGSKSLKKNISMIMDRAFFPNITEKDVENEKGIINEEIDMTNDDPLYCLTSKINQNLFNNSYISVPILGLKSDINKINKDYLNKIYKTFYTPNNMFLVVVGNFKVEEILEYIKEYMSKVKTKNKTINIKSKKENEEIKTKLEEVTFPVSETKVVYAVKSAYKNFPKMEIKRLNIYIAILLDALFGTTSKINEVLKKNGILKFSYSHEIINGYLVIYLKCSTSIPDLFLELMDQEFKKIVINKITFERKKKSIISATIVSFEDIVEIEDIITNSMMRYKMFVSNVNEIVSSLKYEEMLEVIKSINLSNSAVVKISNQL